MKRTAALVLVLTTSIAVAQVPSRIGYYGRLFDAAGTPIAGNRDLRFSVFTSESGGSAVFSELHVSVPITDGYYTVHLGDATPPGCVGAACTGVPATLFTGAELFLELTVAGETLTPRQRITSVPHAYNARNVSGGVVNATTIQVSGTTVIDSMGRLAGPASYSAGSGLALNGTQFVLQTCADGQVLQFSMAAAGWQCQTPSVGGGGPPSGAAGGDLASTYPNPTVAGLRGRPVSATAPASNEVLKWNGSAWAPAPDSTGSAGAGLAPLTDAPIIGVDATSATAFSVTLGGNRTFANPTNHVAGATYTFFVRQDATGGRQALWSSAYRFPAQPERIGRAVAQSAGTVIGNMTNTAAAFDAVLRQTTAQAAQFGGAGNGFLGKDWGAATTRRIVRFRVRGASDDGFQNPTNGPARVSLQGSNDNVLWSDLWVSGPLGDGAGSTVEGSAQNGLVTTTAYRYHRTRLESLGSDGTDRIAELNFWEDDGFGSAVAFPAPARGTLIDPQTGTPFGNFTSNGGISLLFDGVTVSNDNTGAVNQGTGAAANGIAGLDWGAANPRRVTRVRVFGFSDTGFQNPANGSVTVVLEGSDNGTVWTLLYNSGAITDYPGIMVDVGTEEGLVATTAYRMHRVRTVSNGSNGNDRIAELEFSQDRSRDPGHLDVFRFVSDGTALYYVGGQLGL